MIKKYVLGAFALLLLASCCKPNFYEEWFFSNTTNYKVELRYFYLREFTSSFKEPKTITVFDVYPTSSTDNTDSLLLFVDGKLEQTHYNYTIKKLSNNAKVLQFENVKNIFKVQYYQKNQKELPCGGSDIKYYYTF